MHFSMHADRIIKKSEFRPCNRSISSRQQPARRPASHFLVTPGSRPPIAAGSHSPLDHGPCREQPQEMLRKSKGIARGSHSYHVPLDMYHLTMEDYRCVAHRVPRAETQFGTTGSPGRKPKSRLYATTALCCGLSAESALAAYSRDFG